MKKNYFHLLDSFLGEVYFRVSKHLHIPISEVIYKRNNLDIIMLMRKYGEEIKVEQERITEANKEARKNKRRH
ncbi:MAG: hypothetical protein K8V75_04210 [Methanobrevibacter woesei]|nr:hypothetical protein [Methanobrevibacter woesei]